MALGFGCTVKELKERLSYDEFLEWVAYFNIEPWGGKIDAYRHAMNAYTTALSAASAAGDKSARTRISLDDFLVGCKRQEGRNKRQTPEDHFNILARMAGGNPIRRKNG